MGTARASLIIVEVVFNTHPWNTLTDRRDDIAAMLLLLMARCLSTALVLFLLIQIRIDTASRVMRARS